MVSKIVLREVFISKRNSIKSVRENKRVSKKGIVINIKEEVRRG
jgi:hypothetical protein